MSPVHQEGDKIEKDATLGRVVPSRGAICVFLDKCLYMFGISLECYLAMSAEASAVLTRSKSICAPSTSIIVTKCRGRSTYCPRITWF